MYFLVNVYSPKPVAVVTSNLHRCISHMMWWVLDNILCDLYPKVIWDQGHIMYFIVNASSKQLDVTTSNFADA